MRLVSYRTRTEPGTAFLAVKTWGWIPLELSYVTDGSVELLCICPI